MTPQDIQNLLNRLQDAYNRLGDTNPFANFNTSNITDAVATAAQLEAALRGVNQRIVEATTGIEDISDAFKRSVDEIKNQKSAIGQSTKALQGLQSIAQKLSYDQAGITKLSEKELKNLQEQAKQKRQDLEFSRNALRQEILVMQAAEDSQDLINKKIDSLVVANAELETHNTNYHALRDSLNVRIQQEKEINKLLGLGGVAIEGIGEALNKVGLGSLSNKLGIKEAQEEMRKIAEEIQNSGGATDSFAGKMKVLKGGVSSMGKSLLTNLKDPLVLATFALDQLITALKGSDAAAADMAKGMNMSYREALATRRELTSMASASFNNFVNTKGMQESLMAINKTLGANVMLNEDMLIQFTEMREMAGFTNEELQGIVAISSATGKEMNDITGEFMAQAKISALQNGVLLNEKDLLKGIGQVSAATTLSLGKNPKLIGEAVATAKSLGMELSKVEGIADSLLNFEQSIQNELEAELLLGRDINLEKARQAALNNDLATLAKEISEQAGSAAEFGAMNRIQQEAIAKAVGMNGEDLAKTLFVQEQLAGLTGEAAKEQEDLLNRRIEEVGLAQAQKDLAKDGIEGLREQVGAADKFAATMEKVQELFVMIADPILVMVDAFSPILELVGGLIGLIGELGKGASYFGELLTEWTSGLGIVGSILRGIGYAMVLVAGYGAYAALSVIPVVGPVLGAAAAATIITGGFSAINSTPKKVGDVMSPSDGKTQISTKEGGLFELSKNDDFAAAPGLLNTLAGDVNRNNRSETTVMNLPPPPTLDTTEFKRTNALLEKLVSQPAVFKIGTDEFFTSTAKYSYQIQ